MVLAPWQVFKSGVYDMGGTCVCRRHEQAGAEWTDNAKLIAAAPELLDRLSRLVESCYDAGYCHAERCGCTYCDDLRAANELVHRVE